MFCFQIMAYKQALKLMRPISSMTIQRLNLQHFKQLHCSSLQMIQIKNLEGESQNLTQNRKSRLKKHFETICVWKDQNDLVDHIHSNIVYHDPANDESGLVVINKPYGLPKSVSNDSPFALTPVLPLLAEKIGVKSLQVVKCCERFTSGITLLGTSSKTGELYQKSMARCGTTRALPAAYLAMVKGSPNVLRTEDVNLKLQECPEVNSPLFGSMHKEPVISRHLAKSWKLKRHNIKKVRVHTETVVRSSSGVGIISLSPSSVKGHFPQVYLADLGHPILGDMMYDYRSRTILGKKLRITSHTNAHRTQVLPYNVLELLGLDKGEEWIIPKMLHQYRIMLPKWVKGSDVTIYAPPPDHWIRTCKTLGLNFTFKPFAEQEKVAHYNLSGYNIQKKQKKKEEEQKILTDLEQSIVELSEEAGGKGRFETLDIKPKLS